MKTMRESTQQQIYQFTISITRPQIAFCLLLLLGVLGYFIYQDATKLKPLSTDISKLAPASNIGVQGKVINIPTTSNQITRFMLQVESTGDRLISGKTQVSFRGEPKFRKGDTLVVTGDLRPLRGQGDAFLSTRGIFSTIFANSISKDSQVIWQ